MLKKPRILRKDKEDDYALLQEVKTIDSIPEIGIKVLNSLGKGQIKVGSAKNIFFLLKSLDSLAHSSLDRLSKQKYKLICEVADQIQNNGIGAIKNTLTIEEDVDFEEG